MARLPDPREHLAAADVRALEQLASARADSEGRAQPADVYVRMFNNPGAAAKVGALGEHLRFHASLPDDVRELAILRFAARQRSGYEWSHHQRAAALAGIAPEVVTELTDGGLPESLPDASLAVLETVDAVCERRSIPPDVQDRVVADHGHAGVVGVVALCGLYATMDYMVRAFDIPLEDGLPEPPDHFSET